MGTRLVVCVLDGDCSTNVDAVFLRGVETSNENVGEFFFHVGQWREPESFHLLRLVAWLLQDVVPIGFPKLRDFGGEVGARDRHRDWLVMETFGACHLP